MNSWKFLNPGAALLMASLLLNACQTAPRLEESTAWQAREAQLLALEHWQLQGRVNARYENESHTPRIRWQQRDDRYTIRLWGTLNAGATRIEGQPGFVTFEQGGEVRTASSPEALILEHLGYELPVSQLEYWIKGLPTPNEQHQIELGEFNEVLSMQQSGWTLNYEDYRLFGDYSLPRRIQMSRAERNIRLTFVGLNWTVGEQLN
ncbi:MAG: lipoprotein insertase outer membrane protein LolB [Gammaproteobacteria bacterium]|nr:lipoprotein insertase outer membrane protein LolB [Gammaproteobacteria bacterium]